MSFIPAQTGWLVFDAADGEFSRVIAWCSGGDCLSPVVVTARGQSGVIPMPSPTHSLVWDPYQFNKLY